MNSTKPFLRASWLAIFVTLVVAILFLSLIPRGGVPSTGSDKSNHLLAFGTLAMVGLQIWPRRRIPLAAWLLAYGVLIECLQHFTPHRSADLADVVADGIGIYAGMATHLIGLRLAATDLRWLQKKSGAIRPPISSFASGPKETEAAQRQTPLKPAHPSSDPASGRRTSGTAPAP